MVELAGRNGKLHTSAELAGAGMYVPKRAAARPVEFAKPRPDMASIGFPGIRRYRGLVTEEYLTELSGSRKIDLYIKMRSDGLVEAMLRALRLPVMAAAVSVEPAGEDANAKRAAELVSENLLEELEPCWESVMGTLLNYLWFGFGVHTKNWRLDGGQVKLAELRELHQLTLLQAGKNWVFDEAGHVTGVWQAGLNGEKWQEEFIPAAAMVHLVNDAHAGNPEGRSVLRSGYKHWFITDQLYRFQAIGLERSAVGTPVGKYPSGTAPGIQSDLFEFCKNLTVNEEAAAVFPEGVTLENFSLEINSTELAEAIRHHGTRLTQSILASFLNLGQEGSGGAYALSSDQTDLFLLTLQSIADYVAARLNRSVIRELVGYNIATDQYPTLSLTVSRKSATALATMMRQLTAGTNAPLTWGESDEDWLREQLELPERTEKRPERVAPPPGGFQPGQPPQQGQEVQEQSRRERIDLDACCEIQAFATPKERQRQEDAYTERLTTALSEVRDGYLAKLRPVVEDEQQRGKIAKGVAVDKLTDIDVPGRARYTRIVREFLWDVLQQGREALAAETGQELARMPVSNRLRQWVTARAEVIAMAHLGQVQTATLNRILTGIRAELPVDGIFSDAEATATETLSRAALTGWAEAAQEINDELGAEGLG